MVPVKDVPQPAGAAASDAFRSCRRRRPARTRAAPPRAATKRPSSGASGWSARGSSRLSS